METLPFIDLKPQYLALKKEIDSGIQRVLDHGGYINGPEVQELEKALCDHLGSKYALACANGTDALLIPLMALGIGPGDEVLTSAFSFVASAETIFLAGATPVYVDIDKRSFNIDVKLLEKALSPRTKAIMPVSLYGQPADMDEINTFAQKHGLFVIEDFAQSYGARYKSKKSGTLTSAAATSFYPAKPLGAYGDAGAIFTQDGDLYAKMKEIREHGSATRYHHTRLGINGRLDSIQCAVLLAKLKRYDWEIESRNRIASQYSKAFSVLKIEDFSFPHVKEDRSSVWAQYTITVPHRDRFQKKMSELGVPTVVHYPRTIPDQPWYKERVSQIDLHIPVSRWAADHVVSLPMFPDLKPEHQSRVIEAVMSSVS